MLHFALPDNGLADAADIRLPGYGRNIQADLQSDFASGVHPRCDVDIHAHIEILELRVDQRIDPHAADPGLKRAGGHGNSVADFESGLLPIEGANLRILNDLGVTGTHDRRRRDAWNRDGEVGRVEVSDAVQVDAAA